MTTFDLPAIGPRVCLRALHRQDLEDFHDYRCDEEISRYQGWLPMSKAEAAAFIHSMEHVTGPVEGNWIQLGIAHKKDDRIIGDIGVLLGDGGHCAEVGISLARAFHGKGLAREALQLTITLLFEHTPCLAIHGNVDSRNSACRQLLESAGFGQVGESVAEFRGEGCVELRYILQKPRNGSIGAMAAR